MTPEAWLVTVLIAGLAGLLGFILGQRRATDAEARERVASQRAASLEGRLEILYTELSEAREAAAEALATRRAYEETRGESFRALSTEVLQHVTEQFLQLADQNQAKGQARAEGELERRSQAIHEMLRPIRESLDALDLHQERLGDQVTRLNQQTTFLADTLRRPQSRGFWGEMTLRQVAENAGLVSGVDFFTQETLRSDSGVQRPDMRVRLPGGAEIAIDCKAPMDAFIEAMDSPDEATRRTKLRQHAAQFRRHVQSLSGKAYWEQFERSPSFVVLYVPTEAVFLAALEHDPRLLEDAVNANVLLANPTSLAGLLRIVAVGQAQVRVEQNADAIRRHGREVYESLSLASEAMNRLGSSLKRCVAAYNEATDALEGGALPQGRRLGELGVGTQKDISSLQNI